jgi:Bardet-Biedl syndrome 9 protein
MIVAQYYGHPKSVILIHAGKQDSSRYRLQTDSYEYLWIITQELVLRLRAYFAKKSSSVSIRFSDGLPTNELKMNIDRHLEQRQTLESLSNVLEKSGIQFRAVQKRLLNKFKDKSPSSLENMDALLEATYRQIMQIADNYIVQKNELNLRTNSLNCTSSLYILLVALAYRVDNDAIQLLQHFMTTEICDTIDLVT